MGLTWDQVTFEAVKLAAQFFGALFIARRTVKWALARYKNEKHWERKLQAYTDLLTAIGTISDVLDVWERWELLRSEPTEEMQSEYRVRYWDARQKLQEAIGAAGLLLPEEVATLLETLAKDLKNSKSHSDNWMDAIAAEWDILLKLKREVLRVGKVDLNLSAATEN